MQSAGGLPELGQLHELALDGLLTVAPALTWKLRCGDFRTEQDVEIFSRQAM